MAFVRRRLASESESSVRPNLFLVRDLHLASGTGIITYQLSLEKQLFEACQNLLAFYQEREDWTAVGQIAHTLVSNKERIYKLQLQLDSTDNPKKMETEDAWSGDEGAKSAVSVRVRQVIDQGSDDRKCYCVETVGATTEVNPVLRTTEEFKVLQKDLEAKGLLLNEFATPLGDCQRLSYMLSMAIADPVLSRDPVLVQFMAGDAIPSQTLGNIYVYLVS